MALTGIRGEAYPNASANQRVGPAFLLYYSPAFIRVVAHDDATVGTALRILAELYRSARRLYPESDAQAGSTVTIHLGQIKGLCVEEILATYSKGFAWLLEWKSESEAVVVQHSLVDALSLVYSNKRDAIQLWPACFNDLEKPLQAPPPGFSLGDLAKAGGFGERYPTNGTQERV